MYGNNHQYWANNILTHNSFLGSVTTLINGKRIEQFKKHFDDKNQVKIPYDIQLHSDFSSIKIQMYMPPQQGRAYVVGADPSTGSDRRLSSINSMGYNKCISNRIGCSIL